MKQAPQWVGIDVSKARLEVHLRPSGQQFQVANHADGIAALVEQLQSFEVEQVILEASGGLELAAAQALQQASISISIITQLGKLQEQTVLLRRQHELAR